MLAACFVLYFLTRAGVFSSCLPFSYGPPRPPAAKTAYISKWDSPKENQMLSQNLDPPKGENELLKEGRKEGPYPGHASPVLGHCSRGSLHTPYGL